jgi:uncharacterized membrane protein
MATDPHASPGVGHETSDVDLSGAYRFLIVMTVFLALVFAGVFVTYWKWRRDAIAAQPAPSPVAVRAGERLPPLPRLQTTPLPDLRAFRASEQDVLDTYAWVDKEKGIVRLPIAAAMAILAERGLPAASPVPAQPASGAPGGAPVPTESGAATAPSAPAVPSAPTAPGGGGAR